MAVKKVIEIESNISSITKDVNKLSDSFDDVAKSIDSVDKEISQTKKAVDDVGKTSKDSTKAVKGIAKGFKGIGLAIKAAGIGLVLSLLNTLKEVMMKNQAVADLFAQAFETVSIVFNTFVTAIIDAVKYSKEATNGFDALGKVLNGILTLTLTPMKLSFYAIKLGIQEAMLAWEDSFLGGQDPETIENLRKGIEETSEAIKQVAIDAAEAGKNIVNNIGEAVSEVAVVGEAIGDGVVKAAEKSKEAWSMAGTIVDLRKMMEMAAAVNRGLIEQYDVQAEKQRQIRDDERIGLTERMAANEELGRILEEQQQKMEANAKLAVMLAQMEVDKLDNAENRVALQEAQNELAAIEARVTGQKSEQLVNQAALEKELLELKQIGTDAEFEAVKMIEQARATLHDDELERMRIEREIRDQEFKRQDEDIEYRLEQMRENGQTETAMYANLLGEQKKLKAEYDAYIITSTKETADKELEIEQKKQAAINGLAGQGLQVLSAFAEEGSAMSKKLAQAQIIFDTYKAIQATFATAAANPANVLFPAYPYIQAGLAAAFGAAQLKGLESEQAPSGGGSGGAVAGAVVRPDINVVQANNANQSLSSIDNSSNRPMRAYVTSGDVATAGALERNNVNNAKLGG